MVSIIIFLDRRFAHKQRELELEKQQKDHFKNLSLLTAQIAHEIKNPLNSIYLSFQNLEKYFQPDESSEFYRKAIRGEIKRINNIIQTYTGFRQEPEISISAVNLKTFFEELNILFHEELEASQATLSLDISADITCQSDPNLLKQVFINLISNGIQAKAKSIRIAVSRIAEKIHVILTDDGVGFEPKIREHVFEPFQSGKRSGMGIGLYIVRKLVAALGGDIQLSSWESGHTRFDIYFPDGVTDE
jgi:signal transduction histidine kinase